MKKWSLITHISLFILFSVFLFFHVFETLDYRLQDMLYQKSQIVSSDIVIVAIDDESLQTLGRWPWPRDYHGELIRLITEGQPAVIGYDIIFTEESDDSSDDDYFIQMVSEAENVILPVYGTFDLISKRGIIEATNISKPFQALNNVGKTGHINTIMDNDGIVRKTILNFSSEGKQINSFSWEIYKLYEEKMGIEALEINKSNLDFWNRTHIRYSGKPYSFEIVPFYMLLNGDIPGEYFRDKIVLVGPTAIGLADDYYFTPMAPQIPMYGVEIHGNIIQQFINKSFWTEVSLIGQLIIMFLLSIIGYILLQKFKPEIGAFILFGLVGVLLFGLSLLASLNNGYIISFLYPLGLLSGQYIVILVEKFILEKLEKKRVTDVFGKYVAPQIVAEILKAGESGLKLGGLRRNISVLFVDIRGFTPLSESAEPEEVVSILNDYLTLCANSIFAYGGTLDKYIGDATMALFNAPLDLKNHQLCAVQTAWAMKEGAGPLQEKLEKQFGKTVHFGIGIHTGPAIVGNIGADFRMDYTAIGDTVNTAARIESNSKPGQILISQEVYDVVKEHVEVTDLGRIQMKGKSDGFQIYQVDNLLLI